MFRYLDEVDTLDDVDIDDDVDTELEVDTLTGQKSQQYITIYRKYVCTWSCFYVRVSAYQTNFFKWVDTIHDVYIAEDVHNKVE